MFLIFLHVYELWKKDFFLIFFWNMIEFSIIYLKNMSWFNEIFSSTSVWISSCFLSINLSPPLHLCYHEKVCQFYNQPDFLKWNLTNSLKEIPILFAVGFGTSGLDNCTPIRLTSSVKHTYPLTLLWST